MFPTQITLRNLSPRPELSLRIRELCEKLAHLHPKILCCRVTVEQPLSLHRRAFRMRPSPPSFLVDVQVRLPGREVASLPQEAGELEAAIRKAFTLVRRRLREASVLEGLPQRDRSAASPAS
jgi:hypothetical protein